MLPYVLLLLFLVVSGFLLCERNPSRRKDAIYLGIASLGLILFAAFRGETVGIDYPMYQTYFEQMHREGWQFLTGPQNEYRMEFGFSFLNFAISRFTGDVHVFMAVAATILVLLAAIAIYRDCSIPWVAIFIFVSFHFFGNSMSFIRQSFAIGIFLFAIRYLKEKRFVPYLLIVLLAATFHKSILLLIPFYFLAQVPICWKTLAVYGTGTILIMAFFWPIFEFITQFVYQFYATEEGLYFLRGRDWQTAFIPVSLAVVALLLKGRLLRQNPQNGALVHLAVCTGLLFILTCQHYIFQRIGNIFFAGAIFLLPELLKGIRIEPAADEDLEQRRFQMRSERKQQMRERRKRKSVENWHRQYYYYSLGVTLFFGTLYYIWFLLQNRINLIPYVTFF